MNWRLVVAFAITLSLALTFVPAFSASSGPSPTAPVITVNHFYVVTAYGYGLVNDSFTFKNNATSDVQIPAIQIGLPSKIASRTTGIVLSPSDQYTVSQAQVNGSTVLTLTPNQPTLQPGASSTVAMKTVLTNILNFSGGAYTNAAKALVLLSPSLNTNVTLLKTSIILPTGGSISQTPSGFSQPTTNATSPTYTMTQFNIQPQASARDLNFTESN